MHVATKAVLVACLGVCAVWMASQPEPRAAGRRVRATPGPSDLFGTALLAGKVILDDDVPAEFVRVKLIYSESWGLAATSMSLEPDGAFEFQGLMRGVASLQVLAPENGEPLLTVPEVQVGGDRDPRLAALDLSGLLLITEVELLGHDGARLERAQVAWRPSGEGGFRHFVLAKEGLARVVSHAEAIDLYVQAPGYGSRLEREVSGATRVILREPLPLELLLPDGALELLEGTELWIRLARRAAGPGLEDAPTAIQDYLSVSAMTQFDSEGSAHVGVPAAGSWQIEWRIYDEHQDLIPTSRNLPPTPVDVASERSLQRIRPALSLDSLRAALAGR